MDSARVKEKSWIFPLLGGIFAVISVFTPASYFDMLGLSMYSWMWGFSLGSVLGYGSSTGWFQDPMGLISGIICSFIIFLVGITMIISATRVRKGEIDIDQSRKVWLISGIVNMTAVITWMILMDLSFQNFILQSLGSYYYSYPYVLSYWAVLNEGFGVIGVFLCGGLGVTGYIICRAIKTSTTRKKSDLESKFVDHPEENKLKISEAILQTSQFKFCPQCGKPLGNKVLKFCPMCGIEFEE